MANGKRSMKKDIEKEDVEEFELEETEALRLEVVTERVAKLESQLELAVLARNAVYAAIGAKYGEGEKYELGEINILTRKGKRSLKAN